MSQRPPIYGLLIEVEDAQALVEAARKTRDQGYRKMDAYSPFPIEELPEALGLPKTRLPWLVLLGGLVGAVGAYSMQYYASVIAYPLNVGGRPLHSWPSFVPVTFEVAILVGAFTAVLAMLALNGLPMPYHPLFHIDRFDRASRDGFFLCLEARDPQFDREESRKFLESLSPKEIFEVPQYVRKTVPRKLQILVVVLIMLLPACRQRIAEQPYYRGFEPSEIFPDNRSARPLVKGTVARGQLQIGSVFFKGRKEGTNQWGYAAGIVGGASGNSLTVLMLAKGSDPLVESFPLKEVIDKLKLKEQGRQAWEAILIRGRERYGIFCSMCHDYVGTGEGMIVQRGYTRPPKFREPRLRSAPVGHFFQVITKGHGAMPAYARQIPPEDRWAITGYIRALQLSQQATLLDLRTVLQTVPNPEEEKQKIPQDMLEQLKGGR